MYDYPPIDRMNVQRPRRHGMLFLAFPAAPVAAEISRRTGTTLRATARFKRPPFAGGSASRHPVRALANIRNFRTQAWSGKSAEAAATIESAPVAMTFDRLLTFGRNTNAKPLVLSGGDGN